MKISHACVLLACAHSALAGRATLAKGKQQVAFPPPPAVVPVPPVVVPSPPTSAPAISFTTPGLEFGLNVAGYTAPAVGTAQQTAICNAITAASGIVSPAFMTCTVTGVVSLSGPVAAAVYGYATVQWYSTPTAQQLNLATAQVATLLGSLSTNTSGVFAGTTLTVTPNCACDGTLKVTDANSVPFGYAPIVGSNLPTGFCDAKQASTVSVGIDDGSIVPAYRGKFCSSPVLVTGGVAGSPGAAGGSCKVYGVSTGSTANSATAVVSSLAVAGVTVTAAGVYSTTFPAVAPTGGGGAATFAASVGIVAVTGTFGPTVANDFTSLPVVVVSGAGGSGAAATPVMGLVGSGAFVAGTAFTTGAGCTPGTYPITTTGGGSTAVGTATITAATVTAIALTSNGAGFTTLPTSVAITMPPCATTQLVVLPTAFNLYVQSVTVTSSGSGYTALPVVTIVGGGGTPVTALAPTVKVTSISAAGTLTGYTAPPTVAVTGTFTAPATAVVNMGITGITMTKVGANYASVPAVTITQGGGSGATGQAVVTGGTVSQIVVTNAGTGYTSIPTVVIAPSTVSNTVGQLCAAAGDFIAASGSLPAIGIQTVSGPSSGGASPCAPIGLDSVALAPCSTPTLASGGISGTQFVGTCSVISSFVPAPTATQFASSCALMPVAFTTTVTPSPPAPAPAPVAPAPAPKAPVPSPVAPACTYGGNYRMEAVGRAACGVEFPSYYGGSPSNQTLCSTQSIQLRTEKQLPKVDRATFEITAAGEIKTVRRGCAAGEAAWTPVGEKLRLRTGVAPKFTIEASAGDCNLVAIKANLLGSRAPYVSSPSPSGTQGCKSRQLFMTDKIYDTGRQLYRLRKV